MDAPLFRRVVRDLWEAAGAHPVPRSRRIEVLVEAPWVELRVVRDADPIDPEALRALFEPFDPQRRRHRCHHRSLSRPAP